MFNNIRIVLINTFHPGNIGSVARAMKTMGLSQLYLVQPHEFPAAEANTMAASADDILQNARVVSTLAEAIGDCALTIATSARSRASPWPVVAARDAALQIVKEAPHQQVAIVFGRETMGLHNDELQMCQLHAYIPSHPDYKALNLAAAVQIMTYEIYLASEANEALGIKFKEQVSENCTQQELEYFYQHLEATLTDVGFIIKKHPGNTMLKLKRFFNRARPEKLEMNMLRGILTSIQNAANKNS